VNTQSPTVPIDAGPLATPSIADGVERQLDPRYVAVQRIEGWIAWACLSFVVFSVAGIVALAARPGMVVSLLIFVAAAALSALLAWHGQAWPEKEHRHAAYKVDEAGIEIRSGVFWRRIVNVPRSRVQHTDVSQGPIERRYGLATLLIYTAGTDHARVALHGLDHAAALRIRDHLLPGSSDDAV
jgi:membrane protein YdbS with pleckstrin-like domain